MHAVQSKQDTRAYICERVHVRGWGQSNQASEIAASKGEGTQDGPCGVELLAENALVSCACVSTCSQHSDTQETHLGKFCACCMHVVHIKPALAVAPANRQHLS